MFQNLLIASILIFQISGCTKVPDRASEIKAVEKVIEDNIGWFRDKDLVLSFSTMSNDSDLFMYQPDSKSDIRGFDELKKYSSVWMNPDVKYAGHKFYNLKVSLSKAGDAAWFSTILEDCSSYKNGPARCLTTRYTGVLEKRDNRWVLVQLHFSIPADSISADWKTKAVHPPTFK